MVRLFRRKLDEKGLPFVPMSDRWIVRWIERWIDDHYDQYVQATRGHRATLNECAPFLRRDWNLLEVGDCLVADGHVWNGEIAHPVTGKPCRPVVLEFYDMRSNMVLGTEVMPTENIRSIASAFRRAVIRLGKYPKYVLLDNGKAFRAKFFKGCKDFEQAGIRSFYQKFCKEIIFAKVRNARSKPIERHFKDKGELERLSPSYVGTSINNKPARMIQGEVLHQRFWQKMTGGKLPTIEELYFAIVDWNENEYAYRKQEKSHLNGERPIDVLNAGLGAGVDVETLNELMLFEVDKKLEQNGIKLRINGADEYFYHEIFYGKRRRVRVRYDRYAIVSKVINWVEVNFDGEWYKAYRREKTHPLAYYEGTKADQEEVETQLKQQAHLVKQTEKDFREYVEADAKQYMSLPEPEKPALPTPVPVKNEIDVEAVLKVVDDLTSLTEEPQARPIFMSATERYKWLVGNPSAVSESDRQFMDEYSEGLYGLN
jgi:putative transposase